jgi:hypothetical protein
MLIIFIMGVTRINLICNKVYKESSGAPRFFWMSWDPIYCIVNNEVDMMNKN